MNDCLNKYRKQRIPSIDPSREYSEIKDEIQEAFDRVMNNAWYILGDEVKNFEANFAKFCEAKYAIGTGTGLDALTMLLDAFGIAKDDEVVISANTHIATALAVHRLGAKIVLCDTGEHIYNIDPDCIENKITNKTKALLITHMHGIPCDLTRIKAIKDKYQLILIDDSSHAHGSKYQNQKIGSLCDASAFSLYPIKNLGAYGDAGIVTTNNEAIAKKISELRNYGSKSKNEHYIIGYNSRLDELQAAFLSVKLKYLDDWHQRRYQIAKIYTEELASLNQIKIEKLSEDYSYYSYPIRVLGDQRDKLKSYLEECGIGTMILYPKAIHQHQAMSFLANQKDNLTNAERVSKEILCLPISPHHSHDEIYSVCTSLKSFFK